MTRLEALKMIAARDGGVLTPAAVIKEAKSKDSPLHDSFTWDNTLAARKWRVLEAQRLIRSFTIEIRDEDRNAVNVPMFIGVSSDRKAESENNPYRLYSDVAKSEDLLSVAIADALYQLNSIKERFSHIKKLDGVWKAIDAAMNA